MIAWIQMPGGVDTGSGTGDPRVIPATTVSSLTVQRRVRIGHTRSFVRPVQGQVLERYVTGRERNSRLQSRCCCWKFLFMLPHHLSVLV